MKRPRGVIVFVPGKNPKPAADVHRSWLLRALLRGVELYDPQALAELKPHTDRFRLAAWNSIFYRREDPIDREIPWIEELLHKTQASEADRRATNTWRIRVTRALYAFADRFPQFIALLPDRVVKETVKETRRYFYNHQGIGRAVREVLKNHLRTAFDRDEPVLLIAHSMGSVIAYDALWELWFEDKRPQQIDLFVTIGSPLGMDFVQRRLLGHGRRHDRMLPGNIKRWANVAAHGDLTALDPVLCDDFRPLLSSGFTEYIKDYTDVYTYYRNAAGLNFHRSYGYLAHPLLGELVTRWWRSLADISRSKSTVE